MRLAGSTAARVGGVAIAMLVVAALAVWVLAPDGQLPDPLPVTAQLQELFEHDSIMIDSAGDLKADRTENKPVVLPKNAWWWD